MKTWILVANSSIGSIYESCNLRTKDLFLVKNLSHAESRLKGSELLSDGPGHFSTCHCSKGAYNCKDYKEIEADHFSKELANVLTEGFNANKFERLIIVAVPHFYGLIKKHINFNVEKMDHISKDYTKFSEDKLLKNLIDFLYI